MRMKISGLLLLLTAIPAFGQEAAAPPTRLDDVMAFVGSAGYTQELADKGVQGRVVLSSQISTDGSLAAGTVEESSGSPELDAAAPALLASLRAKPQPAPKPVLVPILFYKDSVEGLPSKTCADFNIDYAYFRSVLPDMPAGEMNVFDMAAGVAVASGGLNMAMIGQLKSAPEKTVAACARKPAANFMKQYLASMRP